MTINNKECLIINEILNFGSNPQVISSSKHIFENTKAAFKTFNFDFEIYLPRNIFLHIKFCTFLYEGNRIKFIYLL